MKCYMDLWRIQSVSLVRLYDVVPVEFPVCMHWALYAPRLCVYRRSVVSQFSKSTKVVLGIPRSASVLLRGGCVVV